MKNVIFKDISIQNFMSYGKKQTIDFREGITAILSVNHDKDMDSNGGGKTVIFDAIAFAFFGNTIKDMRKEEVVNRIAKKDCVVELNFDVDENGTVSEYTILRGISPSFCRVSKNGEDVTLSGIPATNDYISNLIGTTEQMFQNTVMMSAEQQPFMRQRKNEKREFIEGVFSLEFIKRMAKIVKSEADDVSKKYYSLTGEYSAAERNIENIKSNIEITKQKDEENKKKLAEKAKEIEKTIADLESGEHPVEPDQNAINEAEENLYNRKIANEAAEKKRDKFKAEFAEKNAEHKSRERTIQTHIMSNGELLANQKVLTDFVKKKFNVTCEELSQLVKTYKERVETLKAENDDLNETKHRKASNKRVMEQECETLKNLGNVCEKCHRPFDNVDLDQRAKRIEELKADAEALNKQLLEISETVAKNNDTINRTLDDLDEIIKLHAEYRTLSKQKQYDTDAERAEIDEIDKSIEKMKQMIPVLLEEKNKLEKDLADASDKVYFIKNQKEQFKLFKEKVEFQRKCLEDTKVAINTPDSTIEWLEKSLKDSEKELDRMRSDISDLEHKGNVYALAKEILSDDGFRAFMIKRYVGILNDCINRYLGELGAPMRIKFDEFFEDTITDTLTGEECSYASLSSGEKRRLDLATLLALVDMREMQGVVKFNYLFFDEIFDSALSASACSQLMKMLVDRKDKVGENSLLITHKSEMQSDDNIDHVLMIDKIGGISSAGYIKG